MLSIAFAAANPELHAGSHRPDHVTPGLPNGVSRRPAFPNAWTRAGDLRRDDYGSGYDLVFVSAICHMLGPVENLDMLRKCFAALAPGGRVVIQDFILEKDKTTPLNAAMFSLNMLVGTERGSSYSEEEYADWLREAGFGEVRRIRLPGPTGLMIARRL